MKRGSDVIASIPAKAAVGTARQSPVNKRANREKLAAAAEEQQKFVKQSEWIDSICKDLTDTMTKRNGVPFSNDREMQAYFKESLSANFFPMYDSTKWRYNEVMIYAVSKQLKKLNTIRVSKADKAKVGGILPDKRPHSVDMREIFYFCRRCLQSYK